VTGPADQTFYSITGVAGPAIGVVGTSDLISYEGAAWSPTAVPATDTIHAVWGSASDDIFAVGRNGMILHHDGLAWARQAAPVSVDLRAVWGTGPADVYAAGDDFTLLHYDGLAWSVVHSGVLAGSAGAFAALVVAGNDVIAAGSSGVFDDVAGSPVQTSAVPASALWGTSAMELWAAGPGIAGYDGATWTATTATLAPDGAALAGNAPDDIYAVGSSAYHFDGATWSPGPFGGDFRALSVSPLGVFAAGADGALARWDGSAVEPFIGRTTVDLDALFAVDHVVVMAGLDGTLETLIFHR
jgi:hypothetical protein